MLRYNFEKAFKAKGIDKPFTFLCRAGFSGNFATKVKNNKVNRLSLDLLERLCLALESTPNDLMSWQPGKNTNTATNHPLYELRRTDKIIELNKALNRMSLSKLEEIERLMKEVK